jgi:hypothetical protein
MGFCRAHGLSQRLRRFGPWWRCGGGGGADVVRQARPWIVSADPRTESENFISELRLSSIRPGEVGGQLRSNCKRHGMRIVTGVKFESSFVGATIYGAKLWKITAQGNCFKTSFWKLQGVMAMYGYLVVLIEVALLAMAFWYVFLHEPKPFRHKSDLWGRYEDTSVACGRGSVNRGLNRIR